MEAAQTRTAESRPARKLITESPRYHQMLGLLDRSRLEPDRMKKTIVLNARWEDILAVLDFTKGGGE